MTESYIWETSESVSINMRVSLKLSPAASSGGCNGRFLVDLRDELVDEGVNSRLRLHGAARAATERGAPRRRPRPEKPADASRASQPAHIVSACSSARRSSATSAFEQAMAAHERIRHVGVAHLVEKDEGLGITAQVDRRDGDVARASRTGGTKATSMPSSNKRERPGRAVRRAPR